VRLTAGGFLELGDSLVWVKLATLAGGIAARNSDSCDFLDHLDAFTSKPQHESTPVLRWPLVVALCYLKSSGSPQIFQYFRGLSRLCPGQRTAFGKLMIAVFQRLFVGHRNTTSYFQDVPRSARARKAAVQSHLMRETPDVG